jgi:hypothetical protein
MEHRKILNREPPCGYGGRMGNFQEKAWSQALLFNLNPLYIEARPKCQQSLLGPARNGPERCKNYYNR